MKQIVSEIESNWCFQNNVKTCLQNKKLIFPVKMVELPQLHANATVHCRRVPRAVFENVSMHKNWSGFV